MAVFAFIAIPLPFQSVSRSIPNTQPAKEASPPASA
jgi:hypothetical protein